jgi:ubiquinone/menaquinone biosynthesis C-methylase UbiE|tara:strand:+ start:1214 stop:1834 length:621 start_codon:yes stop_codon:yes gene_type:complete
MSAIQDKNNILGKIKTDSGLMLELGCGESKKNNDAIAIDLIDFPGVDIVGDIYEVLQQIPSGSISYIYSSHVFEHLDNLPEILIELHRVLQREGELDIIVPHFSNSFFYSDPTHNSFFGLYTFSYYFNDKIFSRSVPKYALIDGMQLFDVKLIFRSYRPRYLSHGVRKIFQFIFNCTTFMQEMYEESFVNFVSCYEIRFKAKKIES